MANIVGKFAKRIDRNFVEKYRDKEVPWGPLGYITYKRTYARLTGDGVTEDWWQTVERCCNGVLEIGGIFTQEEIQKLYDHVFNLRCSFSGRGLWQLGTSTVAEYGADSLCNCWCVKVDSIRAFEFLFYQLMVGGGVGFVISSDAVNKLPPVKSGVVVKHEDSFDVDFIVPDNREGWVKLLRKVLEAFLVTGKSFTFTTKAIRPAGLPIKGFGGKSSGPEPLLRGMTQIIEILHRAAGRKLKPVEVLDIMNIIGSIVVAGNVRRSAEIALGDPTDTEFLMAKRWDLGQIPHWRAMSNNSILIHDFSEIPDLFWEGYRGNGEPYGIVNLSAMQKYGRYGEVRPDPGVVGCNPCGEISLHSYEPCNLSEVFLPRVRGMNEFLEILTLLYKYNKAVCAYNYVFPETNDVVHNNMRIGIGLTGLLESEMFLLRPFELARGYLYLRELDKKFSKEHGFPESIRLTTVKPSGTLSLLPGVTPGAHPAYSPYYIRRIRFAATDPLVDVCRRLGYPVEPQLRLDGTVDDSTMVVSFPVASSEKALVADEISALKHISYQIHLQSLWADNSVSITIYYRMEELDDIKKRLAKDMDKLKSISFLLHQDHNFPQAPYEPISKEQYLELKKKVQPFTREVSKRINGASKGEMIQDLIECEGGHCPVR